MMEVKRVLVVDDDDAFRELVIRHLSRNGFQVTGAKDGQAAMKCLRADGPFAVMVTDLMMPGISGLEMLRFARKHDPDIEVIMITAGGSLEMAVSALREDGAFDFLTKPLEIMAELSMAVERAYQFRALRADRERLRLEHRKAPRWIRSLLESADHPILLIGNHSEIVWANKRAASFFRVEHLASKDYLECLPDSILGPIRTWKDYFAGQTADVFLECPSAGPLRLKIGDCVSSKGSKQGWILRIFPGALNSVQSIPDDSESGDLAIISAELHQAIVALAQVYQSAQMQTEADRVHLGKAAHSLRRIQQATGRLQNKLENGQIPAVSIAGDKQTATDTHISGTMHELTQLASSSISWKIDDDLYAVDLDPVVTARLINKLCLVIAQTDRMDTPIQVRVQNRASFVCFDLQMEAHSGGEVDGYNYPDVFALEEVRELITRMRAQFWVWNATEKWRFRLLIPTFSGG